MRRPRLILWSLVILMIPVAALSRFQGPTWLAEYSETAPTDTIATLQKKLDSGAVQLQYDDTFGYLRSVLKALNISPSSQTLVFSKTSFQLDKIAPWSPRAVYFNDDVYIGYVQTGNVIEVASVDPTLGAVFYTLVQQKQFKPTFMRQTTNCLQCHDSMVNTNGVPGFMVQSSYVDRYGYPMKSADNPVTTDRTPMIERFGGWFVTGTHGDQIHMGNLAAPKAESDIGNTDLYIQRLNLAQTSSVDDLSKFFKTDRYLTPHSDIVALMLLAHQTSLHTLMTQTTYDPRVGGMNSKAEALVRALLFSREAPLPSPIKGSPDVVANFEKLGPRDHLGRSLRDLDLNTRLMKYPLSYLIYSEGFDGLPVVVKRYVARRLGEVLTGKDQSEPFKHLTDADRKNILEILQETKPGFIDLSSDTAAGGE